ncbi:hypothetical protein B1A99_18975 [Cohnella sp. CIP 111063]|uniref:hypothetical protein n=1 Tax=unclassified Cohnella TaxID=2636738 RepID=UPI000B8C5FF7|nr:MULTISPECIES: hypothetical protein [unclassified Cohnella]OXS56941.1 hypothetical protein B1A99_18975 [Cohnella sp. CIP 111063]PRX69786.1 hypothetical protein B0G52_112145 [Cohnella sp. SGD-V74]
MPYESGGRADKRGNRFEIRWVIHQILKVLDERLDFITLEALGDEERGVDIWIGRKNGIREAQQCKGRNASKEYWDYGTANARGIFTNWKFQLERNELNTVALVSPLAFTLLEDLVDRAKNTSNVPQDFYHNQILTSSKELQDFFKNFCKSMDIIFEEDADLIKCISLLRRISYRQFPDSELKEIVLSKINYLFLGDEVDIYEALVTWVIDGDILGKQINQTVVYQLLSEKGIRLRNLAMDSRVVPRLKELNREYRSVFIPLNNELIERTEFALCRKVIQEGESLIIHGKAGRGKSGCTEDIINYCLESGIPYLAIKLDKRLPSGTAERWGEDLGFPSSIVHCIHSISKTENTVIILDQLDALRWTLAHSRDALLVCAQIIDQIERVNLERENKISVIFVCRTYDLENDNNIKLLFKQDEMKNERIKWNKIQVNELNDETVKTVIGNRYDGLTGKLKEILRIPSNLYIWRQLDTSKEYNECSNASHLVLEWWIQLERKCFEYGLHERELNETKGKIITYFYKLGRLSIPLNLLSINRSSLEFLSSNGFLVIQENKISFAHQTILDCFIADLMLKQYYETGNILEVIGDREKQTPGRRYQVQMLLQNLIEIDTEDFLNAGQRVLASDQVRYSVKFVFFEVLNQLDILDETIMNYIVENCEHVIYGPQIINNVIYSKPQYIRLLRDHGVLDQWFKNTEKKNILFNLIRSMSPNYEREDVAFIEKYAFQTQEDDNNFSRCFLHDISVDTDEMFELRMNFYQSYPQMIDSYLDFKTMFKNCEMRAIRLFACLLENKLNTQFETIYEYEDEFLREDSELLIENSLEVIDLLLSYIPISKDEISSLSDWSERYVHRRSLERTCIQIIKKANAALITSNPEKFWERYRKYMGTGNDLFNEIILDGLLKLPYLYSDAVIEYIYSNFDNTLFEKTSGNGDELLLAKQVLARHGEHCCKEVFNLLEQKVIIYISPEAKELYQRRVEFNRRKDNYFVTWSFWGDLQKEVLEVLPYNRLSENAKDLLCVLKRKFLNEPTLYKYSDGHGGILSSPIAGKKLSNKNWMNILTNEKPRKENASRWKEVPGGFVESSIHSFSSSFRSAVSEEPERMIKLILENDDGTILDEYVDSLISGVAFSKNLSKVSVGLLEALILKYPYDFTSNRASNICMIIGDHGEAAWSQKILDGLKDIAINHKNPEKGKPNVTSNEDKEMRSFNMLESNALNCVRGGAAQAIARLLWKDNNLFEQFKETIAMLVLDENPAVKLASLFALWPSYNIHREWASERILYLYEQDFRLAGFYDSKNMLFLLYPQYPQRIIKIIRQCYVSDDKELIKKGAQCISEMFILKNEFIDEMTNTNAMSKLQAEEVLNMALLYFNKDEYNALAKEIILRFKPSLVKFEISLSRLFYSNLINLERDKDFLIEIMSSDISRRILHAFVRYLEKGSKSVIDYKDIILTMSGHLIQSDSMKYDNAWGIQDEISKLIIGLYDETSGATGSELKSIAQKCLDIWDLMFEKQIGPVRRLSQEMMER